jgi:LysM domain-containing protein
MINMNKEDLKYFIKTFRGKQNYFLVGLLGGVLLSLLLVMLFFAFSRGKFCQIFRCAERYKTSQVTATAEVAVEDQKIVYESQPTIEDKELEIIINPEEDFSLVSEHQYRIRKGDSLWNIAHRELGSGYRWVEIYRLNQDTIGSNPDLIYPDVVLNLPQK